MDIRRAREGDLEPIHPILEELMHTQVEHRSLMWRESLNHQGYAAWVAEVNGALAGFIDLVVFPDVAHGCRISIISNLVVRHEFRRHGLGERLLREAIRHCKQQGASELHVWTGFDNTPAIGLYRRVGFTDRALLLEAEL